MLEEFGVIHRAVMVDHICRPAVLAENNVRRIADQRAIESVRKNFGSAHDGVWRVVVLWFQCRIKIDRIDPRISPSRC
jgi:hypothetical protein